MGIDSEVLRRHSRQLRLRLRDNSIGSACSEWSDEAKGGRTSVFDYRQRLVLPFTPGLAFFQWAQMCYGCNISDRQPH
jgi:hypothetical protein